MSKYLKILSLLAFPLSAIAGSGSSETACEGMGESTSSQKKYECFIDSYQAKKSDISSKFQLLVQAAGAGHIQSIFTLGYFYSKGELLEKDLTEGNKFLLVAAEANHTESQFMLGLNFEELAWELPKVEKIKLISESQKWFNKAGSNGHVKAKRELAASILRHSDDEGDHHRAEELLKESFYEGDTLSAKYLITYFETLHKHTGDAKYEKEILLWKRCYEESQCDPNKK